MSNALNPTAMTVAERLDEVAEILANGLIRLHGPKSSPLSPATGESSLDCPGHRSGHADVLTSNGGIE